MIIGAARKLVALFCVGATVTATSAQQPLEARVRELHAQTADVTVTLLDGAALRGQIIRVDVASFTIRQKKNAGEKSVQYLQVKEIRKNGLSRRAKAILIPVAIGGGALLVLCAAPYPIGFLCRRDPS